jgi:LuxR family maltose regulon positive regulatory protein
MVPRPRLSRALDERGEVALTLVSAPAGFGKTTLLTEWLSVTAGRRAIAWLSLDQRDNDPTVFWSYLLSALQTVTERPGTRALALLRSPQASLDDVLATLVNDLDAVTGGVALVLDDYHLIESHEVHGGVMFLLDHLPPHVQLVIATRADPPLPLARLRSRGELVEIRAEHLRFTPDEAAAYFAEAIGRPLAMADITALESRTEGWIAALQLAALSMRGRDDITGFIEAFAGDDRYIVDYLAEEVLQRQRDEVRTFLLETSILARLTGSLCDAVLGRDGGKAMLAELERANLFLVPLDDRRHWFRYHHLFADVLRARLLDEQPQVVPELHRRAAVRYADNGEASEAIRHALAGGDAERAADLVEAGMPALRQNRQEATLRHWLEALPDRVLRERPVLSTTYAGVLLMFGELDGVEERLRDAERWLGAAASEVSVGSEAFAAGEDFPAGEALTAGNLSVAGETSVAERVPRTAGREDLSAGTVRADDDSIRAVGRDVDVVGAVRCEVALYRAAQARMTGDLIAAMAHARRVLDLAGPEQHLLRGAAAGILGLALWSSGDLPAAYRWWSDSRIHLEHAGHHADTLGVTIALGDISRAQGRLHDAMSAYAHGLARATRPGAAALRGAADMHVGMSELCCERNDLAAARQHLAACVELGEHAGLPQNRYRFRVASALLRQAEGDLDGAVDLLDEAERLYVSDMFPDVRPVAAIRARVWVAQGRVDRALAWAHEGGLSPGDEPAYLREYEHITLCRALLAQHAVVGDERCLSDATRLLERLLQAAQDGARTGSVLEILLLRAVAHRAQGEVPLALAALARALRLAEPQGYLRSFVDSGPVTRALLMALARQGTAPEYVRSILAAAAAERRGTADAADHRRIATPGLIDPLSVRELDVLRLLGSDLDGPGIARELVVSLNTVRTHTKNIYAKLGVNSRRAAIRRAMELDLLPRTFRT